MQNRKISKSENRETEIRKSRIKHSEIGNGKADNKYKDYSKSWDWLMPVVEKDS